MMIEFQTEFGKVTFRKDIIIGIFERSQKTINGEFQDIPLLALVDGAKLPLSEDYQVAVDRWKNA